MTTVKITSNDVVHYLYKDLDHAINYMALLDNYWSTTEAEKKELINLTNFWCKKGMQTIVRSLVESLTMTLCRMSDSSPKDQTCSFIRLKDLLKEEGHDLSDSFEDLYESHSQGNALKKLFIARAHLVAHRNQSIENLSDDCQPILGDVKPVFDSTVNLMLEVQRWFPHDLEINQKISDEKLFVDKAKFTLFPSLEGVQFAEFIIKSDS